MNCCPADSRCWAETSHDGGAPLVLITHGSGTLVSAGWSPPVHAVRTKAKQLSEDSLFMSCASGFSASSGCFHSCMPHRYPFVAQAPGQPQPHDLISCAADQIMTCTSVRCLHAHGASAGPSGPRCSRGRITMISTKILHGYQSPNPSQTPTPTAPPPPTASAPT